MELPFAGLRQLCAPMLGRLDALYAAPSGPHRASRSACRPAMLLTAFWSRWPCPACCLRLPRSGRCCVSWMTRSGWTPPRARS